ncbi:chloride channel protein [uncultured Aquabacterium sp.]|uniref:chloride channel protein n=1 Tax=uncultured Aquabacterium sp. TaxID=158753 RepID=UPI0025F168AC|nr:chloride channel protein [uncultured Aquabacterium sp.]
MKRRYPDPSTWLSDEARDELSDWRRWAARTVVIAFAALAGLGVIALTWLSERALETFQSLHQAWFWAPLIWTPALTALIVWLTRRCAAGAAGSGIPQVLAAQDPAVSPEDRGLFVSLRLSVAKVILTAAGILAGLSIGREGPSVQVAAGIMHHARRWLPRRSAVNERGLLVAGGAAGIAAAFNTPLGGVMFAIEELSRRPEDRASGLLIGAIVLAGLLAVSIHGNGAYFGRINAADLTVSMWAPGLLIAVACGLLGGLFARVLVQSLRGGDDRFSRWRARYPVRFAAGCGLVVAVIGLVTQGATFGSGYGPTRALLEGQDTTHGLQVILRLIVTWLSAWSGAPGGIFAPALTIGAGIGHDVAAWTQHPQPALIALGMAGFLAAATQSPITAFIIVMEMVEGHAMVLSLMGCAMLSSAIAKLISPPLYDALATLQLQRLPPAHPTPPADSPR